jgi:hypothetical protein
MVKPWMLMENDLTGCLNTGFFPIEKIGVFPVLLCECKGRVLVSAL